MPIQRSHQEVVDLVHDAVALGVSFEFISEVLKKLIAKTNTFTIRLPLPVAVAPDELVIELKNITQVPTISNRLHNQVILRSIKLEVSFKIVNDSTSVNLDLRTYPIEIDEIIMEVHIDEKAGDLWFKYLRHIGFTTGQPVQNPNLPAILANYNVQLDDYNFAERVQLYLSQQAISHGFANSLKVRGLIDGMSIMRIAAPFNIGFTSEYIVIYSDYFSTDKPDCACAVEPSHPVGGEPDHGTKGDVSLLEALRFTHAPFFVYLHKKPLDAYVAKNLPLTYFQRWESGIGPISFSLEVRATAGVPVLSTENDLTSPRNPGRIDAKFDIHADAAADASIELGPCVVVRSDLLTIDADATGNNAKVSAAVVGDWTAGGVVKVAVGNISLQFGGPLGYPLNLIRNELEALLRNWLQDQVRDPITDIFAVELFILRDIMRLVDPTGSYRLFLESDASTRNSIIFGLWPRPKDGRVA